MSSTWLLACLRSGLPGCLAAWQIAQVAGWLDGTSLDAPGEPHASTGGLFWCGSLQELPSLALVVLRAAFRATGWKPEPSSTGWTPELPFGATSWKPRVLAGSPPLPPLRW